jgi:hypothetical protein
VVRLAGVWLENCAGDGVGNLLVSAAVMGQEECVSAGEECVSAAGGMC